MKTKVVRPSVSSDLEISPRKQNLFGILAMIFFSEFRLFRFLSTGIIMGNVDTIWVLIVSSIPGLNYV